MYILKEEIPIKPHSEKIMSKVNWIKVTSNELYKINSTLGNLATAFKIVIHGGKLDTFLNTSHGDIV